MAKARAGQKRAVRCYLCGHRFDVSARTMSTNCPDCNRPIKVEDVTIKSYMPVNDLQTCGKITITRRGRVVAKVIQSGQGIECLGTMEGAIETDGDLSLGPKADWKGKMLRCKRLLIADGAKLDGVIQVPWERRDADGN